MVMSTTLASKAFSVQKGDLTFSNVQVQHPSGIQTLLVILGLLKPQ